MTAGSTPDRGKLKELANRCGLALKLDTSSPGFRLSEDDMRAIVFSLRLAAAHKGDE
jgi:hypothetical protein